MLMGPLCWVKRLLAVLLLCLLSTSSWAVTAPALSVSPDQPFYSLNSNTRYWHTPESLTLRELLALDPAFTPVSQTSDLHFGYTAEETWLTTRLHNASPHPVQWLLKFEYPFIDRISLYTLRDQFSEVQLGGSTLPVDERALAHRQIVFPIQLEGGESVTLYLQANTSGSKFLSYSLMTPDAFHAQNDRYNFWLATYFGMLLALGLYNFLLFFGLKERVFLHYALFAFGFTLAILTFNGLGTLMFWSFLAEQTPRLVAIGFTFASAMATLFAQSFLNTAHYTPRWHRVISLFRVYCWLALAASLVLPIPLALVLTDVTGLSASLLLLICGIYGSWRRVPSARLFVLAWSIFLLGAAVFALRNMGVLPANFITLHGIQIGSALEMLLLSFALAARFNKLKRQKEQAQADTVAMLKKQEAILEAKVALRTQALEQLANHDMLTGLLNRNGLTRCAAAAFNQSYRTHEPVALIMCDLDRFKPINDQYGHDAGDFVLQQVAKRLAHAARLGDHCARFGGDEFIVLLKSVQQPDILDSVCQRIEHSIRSPIKLPCGVSVCVGISLGVSGLHCYQRSDEQGHDALLERMIHEADQHMYAAKARTDAAAYRYSARG